MSDTFDPADPNRPAGGEPSDPGAHPAGGGAGASSPDAADNAYPGGADPHGVHSSGGRPPNPDFAPGDYGPDAVRGDHRSRGDQFRQGAEDAAARARGAAEKAQAHTRIHLESARGVIGESGDRTVAVASYALGLLMGVTIGASAIVAALLSWAKLEQADAFHASHFRYQLRTFWIGLAGLLGCLLLTLVWIGFPLMLALAVWWTLRQAVGLIRLLEGRPISDPKTWLV